MADKINVPLLGPTPKGGVFAGMIAVVGVGGYLIYKHITKPKTLAPTGTPSAYGYGHAYGYGYVPPSGYGYGYGYNAPYGSYGFGGSGNYPWSPYSGYGYGQNPPITTNAQWGQQVESDLGSDGTDAIAAAIAHYLSAQQLTVAQWLTVQEAIAVAGYPPQQGPDGYPPKAHVSKGGGNGGGGGSATNPVSGLHVVKAGSTGIDIAWNPSQNATSYQVTATHGTPAMTGQTSARIRNVGPRHTTSVVHVLAEPAATNAVGAHIMVRAT